MKEIESNVSLLYTEQKDKREEVDLDSDNLCPKNKKQKKKKWFGTSQEKMEFD